MKKTLILIFLIQCSTIVFSQITIKGEVTVNGNICQSPMSIILYNKDSVFVSSLNTINGCFEFSINHQDKYIIQLSDWLGGSDNKFFYFSNDTSIIIEMNVPKQYSQPCRKVYNKKNITVNLPNEEGYFFF